MEEAQTVTLVTTNKRFIYLANLWLNFAIFTLMEKRYKVLPPAGRS